MIPYNFLRTNKRGTRLHGSLLCFIEQGRKRKEKKKASPSCTWEEKGVDYEQLSETYSIPEVQLFWHKSMKT